MCQKQHSKNPYLTTEHDSHMMLNSDNANHDFSLLSLTGKDGKRFLQGQLSCDLEKLNDGTMLRGALCNLKGRVIASMWLWQSDDVIYIRADKAMADVISNTLNKYMVFFDCKLEDISKQYQCWQLADGNPAEKVAMINTVTAKTGNFLLCLDCTERLGRRYELLTLLEQSPTEPFISDLPSTTEPVTRTDWAIADTEAAWIMIKPAMSEKYTPQLLNFDLDGTVNFKKGCYTGQEVIARMFYRAEAKQRLYRLRRPTDSNITDYGISKEDSIVVSTPLSGNERVELVIAPTDDNRRHPDFETIPSDSFTV